MFFFIGEDMNNQELVNSLHDRNASEVARQTGLSLHTVLKAQKGFLDNLRASSVQKMKDYLSRGDK